MILRLTPAEFQPGDVVHGRVVGRIVDHGSDEEFEWVLVEVDGGTLHWLPNVPFDVERPERMAEFSVEDVRRLVGNPTASYYSEAPDRAAAFRLYARLAEIDAEA